MGNPGALPKALREALVQKTDEKLTERRPRERPVSQLERDKQTYINEEADRWRKIRRTR